MLNLLIIKINKRIIIKIINRVNKIKIIIIYFIIKYKISILLIKKINNRIFLKKKINIIIIITLF